MEFIDEITKRKCSSKSGRYVTMLVNIVDGIYIFGYTKHYHKLRVGCFDIDGKLKELYYSPEILPNLIFSKAKGKYILPTTSFEAAFHTYHLGIGLYPYSFEKKYEAVQNFKLFDNKQLVLNDIKFPIADYVKRSIGLEFETSMGIIPEEDCFKFGLIPLRDGSITGCEYSTTILRGNEGFNLLFHQLETLEEYTHFNKDCSLHIHFGDFPLDKNKIFSLYQLLYYNTSELEGYLPPYSFYTEKYKSNGKSYCKKLEKYLSFDAMFERIAGQKFFGSFTQPHPNDRERAHKWNVSSRYYMCNFVNLLCYNVNKTIEFRFLRPTYNLEKILTWIYVLNAFLDYAEKFNQITDVAHILQNVYPEPVSQFLEYQLHKLAILKDNQINNGDLIGSDLILENKIFNPKGII